MNSAIARQMLDRAARWLQGAERALEDNRWDDVVYCAQMGVEISGELPRPKGRGFLLR